MDAVEEKTEEKLPFDMVEVPVVEEPAEAPATPRPMPVMDVRPPQPAASRPDAPAVAAPGAPALHESLVESATDLDIKRPGAAEATETASPPEAAGPPTDHPIPAAVAAEIAKDKDNNDDPEAKLEETKAAKVAKLKPPKLPKAPKQPREPGVGLAIFTAAVVVLVLAGLATYAYFKSNHIAVF